MRKFQAIAYSVGFALTQVALQATAGAGCESAQLDAVSIKEISPNDKAAADRLLYGKQFIELREADRLFESNEIFLSEVRSKQTTFLKKLRDKEVAYSKVLHSETSRRISEQKARAYEEQLDALAKSTSLREYLIRAENFDEKNEDLWIEVCGTKLLMGSMSFGEHATSRSTRYVLFYFWGDLQEIVFRRSSAK